MRHYLLILCLTAINAQLAVAQVKVKKRPVTNKTVAAIYQDTVPLSRNKYFQIDDARYKIYMNSVINKDSVKLLKASATDWADFANAYEALKKSLKNNQYDNVKNYLDTANDFKELTLLNQRRLPHTAKVCLRQLIFNISLVNQLLAKPLNGKEDLGLLSSVMKNIDVLVASYIAPIGTTYVLKELVLPNVRLRIFNKDGAELNNVKCYFISNRTCRDIACMTCLPAMDPCDGSNINAIIGKADISYDCANPAAIKINFGHYHIFVISRNKIIYTELRNIDGNSIASADNNEIKIIFQ
jgi:hypothetical protein